MPPPPEFILDRCSPFIWFVDALAASAALEVWERKAHSLDAQTEARLSRIRSERDRMVRRAMHIALRLAVERITDRSVRRQPFCYSASGRPHWPGLTVSFSLSHTEGAGLIALAGNAKIGIDIEPSSRAVQLSNRRRHALVKAGSALVDVAAEIPVNTNSLEDSAVIKAWVRLEAYAKATGLGLGKVLSNIFARNALHKSEQQQSELTMAKAAFNWVPTISVADIGVPDGYVAAIAVPRGMPVPAVGAFPTTGEAISAFMIAEPGRGTPKVAKRPKIDR